VEGRLSGLLSQDPGIAILQELVEAQRAGAAVETLRLTTRLIRLTLGRDALLAELRAFWSTSPPSLFVAEEGAALGAFLAGRDLAIPHLDAVLRFERALLRIHCGRAGEVIRFQCNPEEILTRLAAGQLPDELAPAVFDLYLSDAGEVEKVVQL
jgi:hypothetical protein